MANKVYIFGMSGFIGSALLSNFKSDYNIIGQNSKSITLLENDVFKNLNSADEIDKCDTAIFCASLRYNPNHYKNNPLDVYVKNMSAFYEFNKNIIGKNIKHIILLSSIAVYGNSQNVSHESEVLNLDRLTDGEFYYASAKIHQEELISQFCKRNSIGCTILRLPSVYGPGSTLDINNAHVIPAFILKSINQKNGVIKAYGSGFEQREFIFINDLVNFIATILEKQQGILNVTNGNQISIRNIAKIIEKEFENNIEIEFEGNPLSDVKKRLVNNSKIKNLNLKFTDISDGINITVNWYKEKLI